MNTVFALRALLFAGEAFAGAALILLAAWLLSTQKSAGARHLTWTAGLSAALVLPLLIAVTPTAFRILLAAPAPASSLPRLIAVPDVAAAATAWPASAQTGLTLDGPIIAFALFAVWLAGAVIVFARSVLSAFCLAMLKRRSRAFALAPGDLPPVSANRQECELRLSHDESGPMTWGVLRPLILLPQSAVTWPRERLQAVLLHELAHIRRRDALTQAVSRIACAVYWPNPLVWLAARQLRREAEMAADDCVIVSGVMPSQYAGELLQMAGEFRSRVPALATAPLSMAAPSALEARIKSVLASTQTRSGVTSMDVLKVLSAGLLATAAVAFACPSLAQDMPQPAPPAPVVAPDAPPAPESPPAPPAPPKVAVSPSLPADSADAAHTSAHFIIEDNHKLTQAEREQIRVEITRAKREVQAAIAKAKPAMEQAVMEAKAGHDEAIKAMRDAKPQIDEAMVEVQKARPEIEKAIAEVHVSEKAIREAEPQIKAAMDEVAKARPGIDAAIAKAQPEIDAALAKVREELAKDHLDSDIKVRIDSALQRAEIQIDAAQARANARDTTHIERSTVTSDTPVAPEHD
ncbi:MAG: M56 family metallopeptidase [Rhizomicrobium sp.]|jgi:beta-lactamase regulating signal transducer with metallopeptidase domain